MKKNLTELVFILDKSGSMAGLEKDTIGGFNSMISDQQKEEGDAIVSTVFFSHSTEVVHDRVDIQSVKELIKKDYKVGGSTALLDAVAKSIKHIASVHKYIREEDVPEKTMFVITTDGEENSSTKYTLDDVKKMIEDKKENCGWKFVFIGANIDAFAEGSKMGIDTDCICNYELNETPKMYYGMSCAIKNYRKTGSTRPTSKRNKKKEN